MAMSQMKSHQSMSARRTPARQSGFSLVELMIAITIGLFLMSGMALIFVNSVQSRNELEKSSRQIENGRYAAEAMREDIELAGFYGTYLPPLPVAGIVPGPVVWTTPDPCTTVLNNMGFFNGVTAPPTPVVAGPPSVPVGIYGYADTNAGLLPGTCSAVLINRKPGTDVLVVRRVSTTALSIDVDFNNVPDTTTTIDQDVPTGDGPTYASLAGGYYLQVSNCSNEQAVRGAFVLSTDTSSFLLHRVRTVGVPPDCITGELSRLRTYIVRIFYVSTCNDCSGSGDGIPTLKTVDLTGSTGACAGPAAGCGSMATQPIAEGIENLQFEYGLDDNGDGIPDRFVTDPSDLVAAPLPVTVPPTANNWQNVVAVKVFLLARNTETTPGYKDTKTYSLNSAGTALTPAPASTDPASGGYKRHVYFTLARAINIGGRRL
jgi:type IV pilus assembly protein PilW